MTVNHVHFWRGVKHELSRGDMGAVAALMSEWEGEAWRRTRGWRLYPRAKRLVAAALAERAWARARGWR